MENFENDITNALNTLQRGGIILYPTDTIWGLGCDATNAAAVKRIYRVKDREEKKSMIILLAHEKDIEKYVLHPSKKIVDFLSEQQKPTTGIFQQAINLPRELINADGSIAIRIVRDEFCKLLLKRLGSPLVSTSANISGEASPKNFSEISHEIKNSMDYIVQHRQHEIAAAKPSAIVTMNAFNEIEKIR